MIEWSDDAIVLGARSHGENALILSLLTRDHGRHAGLVRGGRSKRLRGLFEAGNRVRATWKARLADHLGSFHCELTAATAAAVLDRPAALAGLASVCAVCESTLPERESHPALYDAAIAVLDNIENTDWPGLYVRWELGLLAELGYGLDLTTCAATGATDDLAYVSPKTGRAVSRAAAQPYVNVLLPLPAFLRDRAAIPNGRDIASGLALSGYFLDKHIFAPLGANPPAARSRFVARYR